MEDEDYFVRIWISVNECGLAALRKTLMKICENERPQGTMEEDWSLDHFLSDHQVKILSNFRNRADGRQKKNQLFPIGSTTNIEEWDLQLVVFILKIVGNLEQAIGKAVDALQNLRNKLCHMKETKLSVYKYNGYRALSEKSVTDLLNFIQNENVKEEMLKRFKTINRYVVVDKNEDWNCRDANLKSLMTRVKETLEPLSKAEEGEMSIKCNFTAGEATNVGEEARLVINLLNDVKSMLTSKEIKVEVPDTCIELVIRNFNDGETHRISDILVNKFVEVRDQIESNHGNTSFSTDDEYAGVKFAIEHIIRKLAEENMTIIHQRNKCVQLDISCDEISTFLTLYEKCISGELTSLIEPLEEEMIKVTGNDCFDIDVVMPETSFWSCVIKLVDNVRKMTDTDFVLYEALKRKENAYLPEVPFSQLSEGTKTLFLREVNAILEPSFQSPTSRLALSLCHTESEGSTHSSFTSPYKLDDNEIESLDSSESEWEETRETHVQITQPSSSPYTKTRFATECIPTNKELMRDYPSTPHHRTSKSLKEQERKASSDEKEGNITTERQWLHHDNNVKEDCDLRPVAKPRLCTQRRRQNRRKTRHVSYMTKLRAFQKDLIRFYVSKCETAHISLRSSYRINVPKLFVSPSITELFTNTFMSKSTNQVETYKRLLGIGKDQVKNICLHGEMGVGKSTVCKMIVLQWCNIHDSDSGEHSAYQNGIFNDADALDDFPVVFYIQMSEVKSLCRVDDMIKQYIINNLGRSTNYNIGFIAQALHKEKCLLILDSLDKWTHPEDGDLAHGCKEISSLPHMTNWPNVVTLITSRSWKVWKTPELSFDRYFLLQGVKRNDVKRLAQNYIKELQSNMPPLKRSYEEFKLSDVNCFEDMFTRPAVLVHCLCLWLERRTTKQNVCESLLSMCFENTTAIDKLKEQAQTALRPHGEFNIPSSTVMDDTLVPFQDILILLGCVAQSTYSRYSDHCRVDTNMVQNTCTNSVSIGIGLSTGLLTCQHRASLLKNNFEYDFVNQHVRDYLLSFCLSTNNRSLRDVSQKLLGAIPTLTDSTFHERKTVTLNEMDDLCGVFGLTFDLNNVAARKLQEGMTEKILEIMENTHFSMDNEASCIQLFRKVQTTLIKAAIESEEQKGEVGPIHFVLYEKCDKDEQELFEHVLNRCNKNLKAIVVNGRDIDGAIVSSIRDSVHSLRFLDLSNTDTTETLPVTEKLEKLKLFNLPFSCINIHHLDLSICIKIETFLAENVRIENIYIENETLRECLIKGCFSFWPMLTIGKTKSLRRLVLHRVKVYGTLDLSCNMLEEIDLKCITVSDVALNCVTMRVCKLKLIDDKVATTICNSLRSSEVLEEIELSFLSLGCQLDLLNSPVLSKVKLVEITVEQICIQTRNVTDCSLWYLNKEATVSIINSMKEMKHNTAVFEFATRDTHADVTQLLYEFFPSMVQLQRLTISDFDIGDKWFAPKGIQHVSFCRTAMSFTTFQRFLDHIAKLKEVVECRFLKCRIEPQNKFLKLKKELETSPAIKIITDDKTRQDFRFETVKVLN